MRETFYDRLFHITKSYVKEEPVEAIRHYLGLVPCMNTDEYVSINLYRIKNYSQFTCKFVCIIGIK